jgi:Pyruvate/2-oxoacid:ferredoxin oxidoreductase delta subunit
MTLYAHLFVPKNNNQNTECYEYCPDSEVLKKAKTASIDYNNELKK